MGNLEKVHNRRKAVILLSDGYDLNPFEGARYGDPNVIGQKYQSPGQVLGTQSSNTIDYDPFSRQSAAFSDADLIRELSELTKAANRANATIYTIDPRGLVAGADLDEQVDPTEWNEYVRKQQESLRTLADLTGGFAAINSNDYTKALKRIDAETSDYYVLGYYSTNPDIAKRRRKLEVKTARQGVEVWSRKEYALRLPPAPKAPKK
jgi:VWFA-related protein